MARSLLEMNAARAASRGWRKKKQASRKTKAAVKKQKLSKPRTILERTLRVSYPVGQGRLVLRTEQDWKRFSRLLGLVHCCEICARSVKLQYGARDVFILGHTDEVAQMPKLHR
jgi:hypothetical protein